MSRQTHRTCIRMSGREYQRLKRRSGAAGLMKELERNRPILFIAPAKRYTHIQELIPELLRLFIRKIVVHEKDVKWSKHARQTVDVRYNDIGYVGTVPGETQRMAEPA